MADTAIAAGAPLAQAIQSAVQPKLMENGWVAEENDTTLSEYVTTMVMQGRDAAGVQSELGGDLLGVGGDDPTVGAFAQWLFEQVNALRAAEASASRSVSQSEPAQEPRTSAPLQDAQMEDGVPAVDGAPSGPKAMRTGGGAGRGRGGRMLGQMNNHMNRESNSLPDPLRRIKGAAGGQHGRIDAHAGRGPPRGPKTNLTNGVQRVMNGGRGGAHANPMASAMGQNNMLPQLNQDQQMAFLQMMEMQANMMSQMFNGQLPAIPGAQQNGPGKSLFERVDKRGRGNFQRRGQYRKPASQNGDAASAGGMDVDSKKEPFESVCRFNASCTNASCPYAHQSPAAPPGQTIDMTDTCAFGAACENRKCAGRHPSPGQRAQHLKQEVDCKFYPNCTNPNCPFKHPDMPLCRNGADCAVPGCKFTHSKIMCRYAPCTKPFCPFKHNEGQKGVFKDKVWTSNSQWDGAPGMDGEGQDTSNRFAELKAQEDQAEELILPKKEESGQDHAIKAEVDAVV